MTASTLLSFFWCLPFLFSEIILNDLFLIVPLSAYFCSYHLFKRVQSVVINLRVKMAFLFQFRRDVICCYFRIRPVPKKYLI